MRVAVSPVRLVLIVIFLLFSNSIARGQITNVTADQTPPIPGAGHDYIHLLNETVNPATGSVSIRVSVPVPPSRDITIPFSFGYDSNSAFHRNGPATYTDNTGYLGKGGWSYIVPQLNRSIHTIQWTPPNGGLPGPAFCNFYNDYVFQDLGGTTHNLYLAVFQPNNSARCLYPGNTKPADSLAGGDPFVQAQTVSYSGGYVCCTPETVSGPDGTVYHFPSNASEYEINSVFSSLPDWIETRNGNKITTSTSANGSFTITDTAGRAAIVSSGFGTSGNTITVSGLPNQYTVTWGTANNNWSGNFLLTDDFAGQQCSGGDSYSGSLPVISAISLPNGQSYQFQYTDNFSGRLNKIIYPGGGYIRYVWGPTNTYVDSMDFFADQKGSLSCHLLYDNLALQSRFVSFDGVHEVHEQDYSYQATWVPVTGQNACSNCQQWSTKTTVVTTKDLLLGTSFTTTYLYSAYSLPVAPYDQSFLVDQNYTIQWGRILPHFIPIEQTVTHIDTNGKTLLTETKGWQSQYSMNCELRTLDNGLISGEFYTYGNGNVVTDKKEYDYGQITSTSACQNNSAAPASPIRETAIAYQSLANTPIYPNGPSIFDRPASVIIYGNGTRVAETDYAYD